MGGLPLETVVERDILRDSDRYLPAGDVPRGSDHGLEGGTITMREREGRYPWQRRARKRSNRGGL